jgi:hypothetical protein
MKRAAARDVREGDQEASAQIGRVDADGIDLIRRIALGDVVPATPNFAE